MILHEVKTSYRPLRLRAMICVVLSIGLGVTVTVMPASASSITTGLGVYVDATSFSTSIHSSQALYASQALGGDNQVNGCSVGLCALLGDPTSELSYSP